MIEILKIFAEFDKFMTPEKKKQNNLEGQIHLFIEITRFKGYEEKYPNMEPPFSIYIKECEDKLEFVKQHEDLSFHEASLLFEENQNENENL